MGHIGSMTAFEPSQDVRAFRKALGSFATGVTVVTTSTPAGPIGITVNSFASVSLDPPLVLWSPDKNSNRHDAFVNSAAYAVHVLGSHQKSICDGFVKSQSAFDDLNYAVDDSGLPIIADCLAVFKCEPFKLIDAGDHTIVIGQVRQAQARINSDLGSGLIYANGAFGTISH